MGFIKVNLWPAEHKEVGCVLAGFRWPWEKRQDAGAIPAGCKGAGWFQPALSRHGFGFRFIWMPARRQNGLCRASVGTLSGLVVLPFTAQNLPAYPLRL